MSIDNINVTVEPKSDYDLVEIVTSQVLASRGHRTPTEDTTSPGEVSAPAFTVRDSQGRLRLLIAGHCDWPVVEYRCVT